MIFIPSTDHYWWELYIPFIALLRLFELIAAEAAQDNEGGQNTSSLLGTGPW